MNFIAIIVIVFITLLILYELVYNYEHLSNYFSGKNSVSTLSKIIKLCKNMIKDYNMQDYIFIDLGCGDGNLIDLIESKKAVGLEIDEKLYLEAKKKVGHKATLINCDILDYNYDNKNTLIYMYDPLWKLGKNQAALFYQRIIDNISTISKNVFLILVSGTLGNTNIQKLANEDPRLEIIEEHNIGSFIIRRNVYLVKLRRNAKGL
jgi:hypothetical protein